MTQKCIVIFGLALAATWAAGLAQAAEPVGYKVTVKVEWSPDSHPIEYPNAAHWSGMFVVTHNDRYSLFADGGTATTGLALLATNGRFNILLAEFDEAERRRRVTSNLVVPPPRGGSGEFSFSIQMTPEFPMVSFATMLAPSPDWIAGGSGIALYDGTAWIERISLPIFVWDAGADSGASFTSSNEETQPRESVRLLAHPSFLQTNGMKPIGTVEIVRDPFSE
jgi:hypothetical protein